MEIKSAFGSSLLGIQRGLQGLEKNAAEVAQASKSTEQGVPVNALVEGTVNRLQVEANVDMIQTIDETIGSLLDEKA